MKGGWIIALFWGIGFSFVSFYNRFFLRKPGRSTPHSNLLLVSPANGTVASVKKFDNQDFFLERKHDDVGEIRIWTKDVATTGTIISIVLDIMNVHYQRAPIDSIVIDKKYEPGRHINALKANKAQQVNEHNTILMAAEAGFKYKVVQIAGLLARRIEDYVHPGQAVQQGQIIGLIKLGSQVTVVLPGNVAVSVKKGDKLIDGESIIGAVA